MRPTPTSIRHGLVALGNTSPAPVAQPLAMLVARRANEADYGVAMHGTLEGHRPRWCSCLEAWQET